MISVIWRFWAVKVFRLTFKRLSDLPVLCDWDAQGARWGYTGVHWGPAGGRLGCSGGPLGVDWGALGARWGLTGVLLDSISLHRRSVWAFSAYFGLARACIWLHRHSV